MSRLIRLSCIVVAWAVAAPLVQAVPTLWTGPTTNYTQPSPHSATVAACQDRLTANVWLTRNSSQPMLNAAKSETSYNSSVSPKDTEWAYGMLSNYQSLHFTNWGHWVGGAQVAPGPLSMVTSNVVLHLKTDDIYLQIKFSSWASHGVGGYTYTRSSPAAAAPAPTVTLTNPVAGAIFAAPANIKLGASASVSSGSVTNVTFYHNTTTPLGSVTVSPFSFTASNLAAGSYNLTAVATAAGISATSAVVNVSVATPVATSLGTVAHAGGQFSFNYNATPGLRYVVQSSSNLLTWASLNTNTAASGTIPFSATFQPSNSIYYRVGRLPNP